MTPPPWPRRLNLVVADVALAGASIYHAGGRDELFLTLASMLMTVLLLAGILRRQAQGPQDRAGERSRLGALRWDHR